MEKLNNIFNEFYKLEVEYDRLGWTLYTTGYDFGVEENYLKQIELLKNKESFNHIKKCKETVTNEFDKRKVEIVYKLFKPYHLSDELNELNLQIENLVNKLSKILNSFRFTIDNKTVTSVDIEQILSHSDNRDERKKAYFAYGQINQSMIDGGFIELINLRKQYAKLAGFSDFIKYKLDEAELPENLFDNWKQDLHDVLPKMKEVRSKYARKYLQDDTVYPWDESYIMSKIVPAWNQTVDLSKYYEVLSKFFKLFGIDITKFNITYDIFPRANKSEWGYNFPIETAKDSRILANVKNKFYEYNVLLHETGHAVHSYLIDPNEPIINSELSDIVCEGIANLFQSFIRKEVFYKDFFKEDNVKNQFEELIEFEKASALKALNNIFFEHRLYLNDIKSLDDIYKQYHENYQDLFKEEPFGKDVPWAYRIHYTTHPIYLQNYLMGDVLCEALFKIFEEKYKVDASSNLKQFGSFLIDEIIKPSGLYKFNDLFKKVSGEDFSLKYLK
ncbi:M2 family metallopeptidase [Mycoplasmatota bacterium]|nr:M2 family metallopeptidase [Mycoplasmatota bacterium]